MKNDLFVCGWLGVFIAFRLGAPFLGVLAVLFLAVCLYVVVSAVAGLFRSPAPPSPKKPAPAPVPPARVYSNVDLTLEFAKDRAARRAAKA